MCMTTPSQTSIARTIYVASSWRNEFQPEVVLVLRTLGHEVYDFRGAGDGWDASHGVGGFAWSAIDANWKHWSAVEYVNALSHPLAQAGFERDMNAMIRADTCIFVMPCGPSASMEMGWACGAWKRVAAYIPAMREPDLMVKMAALVTTKWEEIESWLTA
jgi:hypothetical protein